MRRLILFLIFINSCGAFHVLSQGTRSLSFELAGSGGFGSINFEKNLLLREKNEPILDEVMDPKKIGFKLDFRAGFSFTPVDKNNGIVLIFPVMVHAVKYKGNHGIDFGLGQTFSLTTKAKFFIRTPMCLGYRFQPADKNYYLRFAYTPIFSYILDFQYQHWAGITFAHTIGKK